MTQDIKILFIPIIVMSFIVLISNILVQFLLGNWLTWGALTYPFAFLVTDITNRFYGLTAARKVVLFGFIILIISLMTEVAVGSEPAPSP